MSGTSMTEATGLSGWELSMKVTEFNSALATQAFPLLSKATVLGDAKRGWANLSSLSSSDREFSIFRMVVIC
jgi:hypothetical protein